MTLRYEMTALNLLRVVLQLLDMQTSALVPGGEHLLQWLPVATIWIQLSHFYFQTLTKFICFVKKGCIKNLQITKQGNINYVGYRASRN